MEPFVSIVIIIHNAERTIDRTQVIIDGYAQKIMKFEIKLLKKTGCIGAGRNEGIKHARGEFIAVTDGDMGASTQWLRELINGFEDDVAGVGGPNNNADDVLITNTISCLDIHGPSNDVVPQLGENRYGKVFKSKTDIYTTVCRNSCYRKAVLEEVGGFDERLLVTEDPELNQRILKKGYALKYNPKAVVYHHHRTNLRPFFRQQKNYAFGQAIANVLHPEMFKTIHVAPPIVEPIQTRQAPFQGIPGIPCRDNNRNKWFL